MDDDERGWRVGNSIKLVGECNRCGLCCFAGEFRCQNLIVTGKPGEPMATACAVHRSRTPGMFILFFDSQGRVAADGVCGHNTPAEPLVIIERGIGKGCSLEVVEGGGP